MECLDIFTNTISKDWKKNPKVYGTVYAQQLRPNFTNMIHYLQLANLELIFNQQLQ